MTRVAVARSKFARGFQAGREDAPRSYEVLELGEALARTYPTEAHLVAYVVEGATRQPRINKPGLPLFDGRVVMECLFCDVDNPGHAEWDDASFEAARAQDLALPTLATAGVYYTKRGRRVVQPLTEALPVEVAEAHLGAWLLALEREGLGVDWACRDWTRHYLLPNVRRDGRPWRTRCLDLERMLAIAPPLVAPPSATQPSCKPLRSSAKAAARRQVQAFTDTLPERWRPEAMRLAPALLHIEGPWHDAFLALAGALLGRGLPPEHLPAFCGAVSALTGADTKTHDRVQLARTTVTRWQERLPVTGFATLQRRWPALAAAVDEAFASMPERRLRELVRARVDEAPPEPRSLEELTAAMESAIANAPPGITLVQAACGLGKTQAALRVASARAAKAHTSPEAIGARAPLGSKTSLSVDKNRLALQCMGGLHRLGTPSLRVFGPLSLRDAEGEPVCRLHDVAEPLVAGGLRMQWELCERRGSEEKCPHYDGCTARLGREGQEGARLLLGTHALLGELDAGAGTTGLLVLDEPPDLLETVTLTAAEVALARRRALAWFDGVFVGALEPALTCFARLLEARRSPAPIDACEAVRAVQGKVPKEELAQARRSSSQPDGDVIACTRAAPFPKRHHGTSPPLLRVAMDCVLSGLVQAREVGAVARVLKTVHHALASEYPVTVRVEREGDEAKLLVTAPREQLARALRREGAVVVLDANVDLHAPVLARIVGYDPPLHRFDAPDGAPIERTLIRTRKANRKEWFREGRLVATTSLVFALKSLLDWALATPGDGPLGIITFAAVEVVLRCAAGMDSPERSREAWKAMGQPVAALEALSAELAPLLARWSRGLLTGHYGATRGLDELAGCDALATLGDPWVNLDAAHADAAFLGLGDQWEQRYEARCRAELEQAHGRLRTIHRTRPGRALHVGAVLPSGRGWEGGGVLVTPLEGGTLAGSETVTPARVALAILVAGGVSELARRLGCDRKAIRRYRDGETPVPARAAEVIEAILADIAS